MTGCKKNAAGESNSKPEDNSWLTPNLTFAMVRNSSPQVRILPTRFDAKRGPMGNVDGTKWAGHDVPISTIVRIAYQWSQGRIVSTVPEPSGGYDFIATLPQGSCEALQGELQKQFGLVGRVETMETNVLVLKVRTPNASGLKPPVIGGHKDYTAHSKSGGEFVCNNGPLSTDAEPFYGLQRFLENEFNMPVVDETGLTGNFSIDLKWNDSGSNHEGLKQALANQLGFELVPARRSIKMLVVERAK
jgi:uncharacterized protein (TIGR03435 family)